VQSARETARSNTCRNNIKQLQLALTSYDTTLKKLPGYSNELYNPNAKSGTPPVPTAGRRASWIVMCFPYMEQNTLWDDWSKDFGQDPDAPELEVLICPSDDTSEIPGQPANSYVGNAGRAFGDSNNGLQGDDPDVEKAADGVFIDDNKFPGFGATAFGPSDAHDNDPRLQMSLGYIQANDGTSKTLMVSENMHAWYWTYDISPSGTRWVQVPGSSSAIDGDPKHIFGFVWKNNPSEVERINGDPYYDQATAPANLKEFAVSSYESYGFPTSNHPGGVNMAFCGGQIVFIAETIDPVIYAQLMTPNRKRSSLVANGNQERNLPTPPDNLY
jgi:prepilin-type processing-associated H-X9-DG protein